MLRRATISLSLLVLGCSENQIIGPESTKGSGDCDTPVTGFLDEDSDGWGDVEVTRCDLPASAVEQGGDCDDSNSAVHPSAPEHCDGVDEDCDGEVDNSPVDGVASYADLDADGHGAGPADTACPGDDVVSLADDCDDTDPDVHPGVFDDCDDRDNDCDGRVDEDAEWTSGWVDTDGDGHGDPDAHIEDCDPTDLVDVGDDCDDSDPAISPSAEEICGNGIDDDCDGAASGCLPMGPLSLETEGTLVAAATSSEYASRDFAAGDVDGDGVADLWVGATGRGRAYLKMGPITADTTLATAEARLDHGNQTGWGMAMGDLDGDGLDDLLVGDMWDGDPDQYSGSAWWMPGPLTGVLQLDDTYTGKVAASGYRQNLGAELVVCADADGDGTSEWAIAAIGDGDYAGAVYVFDGAPTGEAALSDADGVVHGDIAGAILGEALASGDLDGDGLPELIAGGSGGGGRVLVLTGDLSGDWVAADADAWIQGGSGSELGFAVASGEDVDGDGLDDLAIGVPSDDAAGFDYGSVDLFLGPVSGTLGRGSAAARHDGAHLQEAAGAAVALLPDIDGDGGGELLVGAPFYESDQFRQGRAYLVLAPSSGSASLHSAQAAWKGRGLTEYAGTTLHVGGDVTGDGQTDLLVGALQENTSGNDAGAIYIVGAGGL